MRCTPPARDSGLATAETAVALPAIALLIAGSLAAPVAVSAELRATDAAREAARAAARGDPAGAVQAAATAVDAAAITVVTRADGLVRVRVTVPVDLPVLRRWEVAATAVAVDEADLA